MLLCTLLDCKHQVWVGSGWVRGQRSGVTGVHVCRVSDVDECQQGSHECTGALMHCVNRPGTYICQCSDGFQMNHALRVCEGIANSDRITGS